MDPRHIFESLDACRTGSDDLENPELKPVADRVDADPAWRQLQKQLAATDEKLAAAVHDVPLPDGLADRLLARLTSAPADPQPQTTGSQDPTAPAEANPPRRLERPRRPIPRPVWAAAAVAAAVLLAAAAASFFWRSAPQLTWETVDSLAYQWYEQLSDRWRAPGQEGDGPAYELPPEVRVFARRWQPLPNPVDAQAVAFRLASQGNETAVLLVIGTHVEGVPSTPTNKPIFSQGRCVVSWQDADHLYVLIIENGTERDYFRCLDTSTGPIA